MAYRQLRVYPVGSIEVWSRETKAKIADLYQNENDYVIREQARLLVSLTIKMEIKNLT